MRRISHWVAGEVLGGESGRVGPVYDPATGEQQAEVDLASAAEVDRAVGAASEAFPAWRSLSLSRRAEIMFKARAALDASRSDLAAAITSEHGKVLSDAMGEVARGLEVVEFACGIPHLLRAGTPSRSSTGIDVTRSVSRSASSPASRRSTSRRWSRMWMFPIAIACGNTFVLKPIGEGPVRVDARRGARAEAGLPDGRVQRRARRQGRGRPRPRASRHRGGELRRLHSDRQARVRDRHRGTASACRRSAARRTTWSCCPTPTSTSRPTRR